MGTTTLLTFAEFERLPAQPGKDELLDGEHFHLPPADSTHSDIVGRLHVLLVRLIDGVKPRRVRVETGFKIGNRNWLIPDVSVMHEDQTRGKFFEGAPQIAIEVVSESNSAHQIDLKRKIYLANGAEEVWVIYPKTQSAFVYREGRTEEVSDELQSQAIPAARISLSELFE
jgi:Uma2 family endonuclease